jgi:hypothetical protein
LVMMATESVCGGDDGVKVVPFPFARSRSSAWEVRAR